ncbi:MAG TPA: LysR family transcriptional regulator [Paenalcaligenes sp.]|nr:LysR family transcriptional regulator [Paenalcaligenes sp.]
MNLSTRHMRAFKTLALIRNFTRAAEECHLSQSAFSSLISNLEEGLGLRLFSRNTRNVDLTREGEIFLDIVDRLLPDLESAVDTMRALATLSRGEVSVAALPTICSSVLPKIIHEFKKDNENVDFIVSDGPNAHCLDLVRKGIVDFALCAGRLMDRDLEVSVLATDNFFLACHVEDVLAHRRSISAAELQETHSLIIYDVASSIRQHLDAAIFPLQWKMSFEVNNLSTAAALVAGNLGRTIIPALGLRQFLSPQIKIIPISGLKNSQRPICLVRATRHPLSLAASAFVELTTDSFAAELSSLIESVRF